MKTRQQSLHDEGWQSRAGKESDAQKLDDVRVAEGAHKLTFPHELGRGLRQFGGRCIPFYQEGVDCFRCGAHRNDHFFHFPVGSAADSGASQLDFGENEGSQPWMTAEKLFSHVVSRQPHPICYIAHAPALHPLQRVWLAGRITVVLCIRLKMNMSTNWNRES